MCLNNWYITDNNSIRVKKRYAKTYVTRRNRWIIKDYAKARFTLHNTFYKVADKFTHARSIPLNRPIWKWIESFGRLECHLFRSFDHSRDSKLANEHPIFPRFSFFHESLRRKIILPLVVVLSYFFPFPSPYIYRHSLMINGAGNISELQKWRGRTRHAAWNFLKFICPARDNGFHFRKFSSATYIRSSTYETRSRI